MVLGNLRQRGKGFLQVPRGSGQAGCALPLLVSAGHQRKRTEAGRVGPKQVPESTGQIRKEELDEKTDVVAAYYICYRFLPDRLLTCPLMLAR